MFGPFDSDPPHFSPAALLRCHFPMLLYPLTCPCSGAQVSVDRKVKQVGKLAGTTQCGTYMSHTHFYRFLDLKLAIVPIWSGETNQLMTNLRLILTTRRGSNITVKKKRSSIATARPNAKVSA